MGHILLGSVASLAAALWLGLWVMMRKTWRDKPWRLDPLPSEARQSPDPLPLVSILVPARNEAERILRSSLDSMLSQDYPNFEVVVVDDCSTDDTLQVLYESATHHERLQVVEGEEPPPEWRGKPHALSQAVQVAGGDWWLVADADFILAPEAIGTALALAQQQRYDAVFLLPQNQYMSFWDRLLLPLVLFGFRLIYPLQRVNDPEDECAVVGTGLMLLRRPAVEIIGGYASIKEAVIDDLALASLLKRAGRRIHVREAPQLAQTPAHGSLRQNWTRFNLGALAAAYRHPLLSTMGAILGLLLAVLPAITAMISGTMTVLGINSFPLWVDLAAWSAYAVMVIAHISVYRHANASWSLAWIAFLGYALLASNLVAATVIALTKRRVTWRGRAIENKVGETVDGAVSNPQSSNTAPDTDPLSPR